MNYLDGLIYYRWYSYSINVILYLRVMLNVMLELLNCWAVGKISDSWLTGVCLPPKKPIIIHLLTS